METVLWEQVLGLWASLMTHSGVSNPIMAGKVPLKAPGEPGFFHLYHHAWPSYVHPAHSAVSAIVIFIPRCSQSTPYVEGRDSGRGMRALGVLRARVGKVGDT